MWETVTAFQKTTSTLAKDFRVIVDYNSTLKVLLDL